MEKKNALSFKKPSILNKDSILTFREHKGETVGEVMKYDAAYLIFLMEKKLIDLDVDLYDEIVELDNEQYDPLDGSWYEPSDDPGSPRY